jgi:antitoxin component HigA of HigAB toxin-antitoxin module
MEQEIIVEMSTLLEKTGLENVVPLTLTSGENKKQVQESTLMNLKSLNARYEKPEAINQVQWLMSTYNIQIDELMERIGS